MKPLTTTIILSFIVLGSMGQTISVSQTGYIGSSITTDYRKSIYLNYEKIIDSDGRLLSKDTIGIIKALQRELFYRDSINNNTQSFLYAESERRRKSLYSIYNNLEKLRRNNLNNLKRLKNFKIKP